LSAAEQCCLQCSSPFGHQIAPCLSRAQAHAAGPHHSPACKSWLLSASEQKERARARFPACLRGPKVDEVAPFGAGIRSKFNSCATHPNGAPPMEPGQE